jgi:hypothetical protein
MLRGENCSGCDDIVAHHVDPVDGSFKGFNQAGIWYPVVCPRSDLGTCHYVMISITLCFSYYI